MTEERAARETFASRFGTVMTMIGVAIGLGTVWRFPYMVGKFGGAAFVLFYLLVSAAIGVPALMAEFALGRHTRRGTVGAFELGGFPFGRQVGWFLFVVVTAATGYYTSVIGWVMYYGLSDVASAFHVTLNAAAILPPATGFDAKSFVLQLACTSVVIVMCALVLVKGIRAGAERASVIIMPALFVILGLLVLRSLTLPGAMAGVRWYILKFRLQDLDGNVAMAALGHMMFSLSLGGTFMVVYGSYLDAKANIRSAAIWTVVATTGAGLLAGLAIIPAVIALGMEPGQGPGLLFSTIPKVFAAIPFGWLFGALFFAGLFGAAYLSDIAAFEVLVAALTDNSHMSRTRAVWLMSAAVLVIAIPPMFNMAIFLPWDLTFGSGMQTLGSLLAVLTIGWCVNRSAALTELSDQGEHPLPAWMIHWIRFGIPAAIIAVGVWWFITSVLHPTTAV